jgi:PIN domain nuclease of toxin-antitoxin system
MRLLLDTHALMWWLDEDPALSARARAAIADRDNTVAVSAASAWEISTKYRLGKMPQAETVAADVGGTIADEGFIELPVTVLHGQRAGELPGHHRDPFDRMLIAQALAEELILVSKDQVFDLYGASRLW